MPVIGYIGEAQANAERLTEFFSQPAAIADAQALPGGAAWNPQLSEFILLYDDVRRADSPEQALIEFLESTYNAGASLAKWDRGVLERPSI